MRNDKETAISLRREGYSYKKIRAKLRIPLGTLSVWFKDIDWSAEIRQKLQKEGVKVSASRIQELNKIRGQNLVRVYEEAREEARRELETLKYNPLFVSGIMLYWGEGTKTLRSQVRLSNSDPEMIKFYVNFLQKACRIPAEKLRAAIVAYPDLDESSVRRFWAFATGIPLTRFHKTQVIQGKHSSRRLAYGVCTIIVSSSYFREKMGEWLKVLPNELMGKEYYENIANVREKKEKRP